MLRRTWGPVVCWFLLSRHCSNSEPLDDVASKRLLISFGENCDEAASAARVLSSVLSGSPHRHRPSTHKEEEAVLSTESFSNYTAYSRSVFSFKRVQVPESSDITNHSNNPFQDSSQKNSRDETAPATTSRNHIVRCSISQTTFKLVNLSVLSIEDCPSVSPPLLKEAFQYDPCIESVEFDAVVRLSSHQELSTQRIKGPGTETLKLTDVDGKEESVFQSIKKEQSENLVQSFGSNKDESVPEQIEYEKYQFESVFADYWRRLINLDTPTDTANGSCRREVVVGVIDSGIAYSHPALIPNIWTNKKEIPDNGIDDDQNGYVDDVHGFNFFDKNGSPTDPLGHGTHVAGIIGAVPGYTRTGGVCKEISIAALRFMDKFGSGTIGVAIEALNYAVQMGFQVSCNSWGGPGFSLLLKHAIVHAHKSNHLFVAAAGNNGLLIDLFPEFPAAFSLANIITVGASDERDRLASFSNYGARLVHLTAPGVNIYSTYPPNTTARLSGTSMAAPIVAAVCAMLFSVKANPLERVKHAILNSVDKLPQLWGRVGTGGRVNVSSALKAYLRANEQQQLSDVSASPPLAAKENRDNAPQQT